MRILKHIGMAVACATIVALSSLTLFLCSVWLLSSASLVQSLALTGMSVLGSGVIALAQYSSPTGRLSERKISRMVKLTDPVPWD
jgi:hypothetical protein